MAGNRIATISTNTTKDSNVGAKADPPELIYLAKTIYGEARGQNHESKVAVGWTIRNRVDRGFHGAHTYRRVVTARGQYDAWMKSDPNYQEVQHPSSKPAWADSLQAAREVYYGDPTSNTVPDATHYYSPNSQDALHKKYPSTYPAVPSFITPAATQVQNPPNVSENDFRFYKNVR
jgi:spore germination cell wall hydrolase CwlJ-like protein